MNDSSQFQLCLCLCLLLSPPDRGRHRNPSKAFYQAFQPGSRLRDAKAHGDRYATGPGRGAVFTGVCAVSRFTCMLENKAWPRSSPRTLCSNKVALMFLVDLSAWFQMPSMELIHQRNVKKKTLLALILEASKGLKTEAC